MNTITVVVPVYNQERYIVRCINSILNQTFKNYFLILIDDGSSDKSASICDELLQENGNIVVIHEKNMGLSFARNMGIELNDLCLISDWITFIDSDDWVDNRYFELLIETAQKYQVSVVASDFTREDYDKNLDNNLPEIKLYKPEEFICADRTLFSVSCCKLFKSSCFESIRFPVGKYNEDEYTTYKILFNNENIARIAFPLYNYYVNTNSITQAKWTPKRLDVLDALCSQIDFFKANSFIEAYHSSVSCYLWILYDFSKTSHSSYPYLSKKIKKRFVKELDNYKDLFPVSDYGYFYSYARPFSFKAYLLLRKLKRLLRHK